MQLLSIWRKAKDPSNMVIARGSSSDVLYPPNGWKIVVQFYVFSDDVGYDTKPFSVSKLNGKCANIMCRIVQKGKIEIFPGSQEKSQYTFWTLPKWQPGLMVRYNLLKFLIY